MTVAQLQGKEIELTAAHRVRACIDEVVAVGVGLDEMHDVNEESFSTKRQKMPAEPADDRTRQRVEAPDEQPVVDGALPAAVEPRLDREPFGDDPHVRERVEEAPELADAEFHQHRRRLMFEPHVHQLRQRVQPRNPVVHLNDGFAIRSEHTAALLDQALGVSGVLNDSMRIHEGEPVVGGRQVLAVGDFEMALEALLREVGARELDGGWRDVDAGDIGSASGKTGEVDGGAATDVENRTPAVAVKVDEPAQVVQLLEMIPVEIVEELARTGR